MCFVEAEGVESRNIFVGNKQDQSHLKLTSRVNSILTGHVRKFKWQYVNRRRGQINISSIDRIQFFLDVWCVPVDR